MRHLLLALALLAPSAHAMQAAEIGKMTILAAKLVCPAKGSHVRWTIDSPQELVVMVKFSKTGNFVEFVEDMKKVSPQLGEAAARYLSECLPN